MRHLTLLLLASAAPLLAQSPAFTFGGKTGERELLYGGKPVLRHMTTYDPARRDETFKPYLHVFDFDGKNLITKGPGGQFTHHRGAFIGWNKTMLDGKSYDFWHCKNVERLHQKYLADKESADGKQATMVSLTHWPMRDGKVVVAETQTIHASYPAPGRLQLDFTFLLEAPSGPVNLQGDAQHSGFHFRAAEEVQTGKATYVRPDGAVAKLDGKGKPNDIWESCPWVAASFAVQGQPLTVAHFNHPKNPAPITYSTRNYGRFGAFSTPSIEPAKPLTLRYRITVLDGRKGTAPSAADWAKDYADFAK